jgi:benzylsuccinate CoA-transferase BbsF subunit
VSIAVAQEPEWTGLVKALGRPEWLSTPRFADAVSRWQHRHELDREIAAWTRTRTREQATQLLQSHGVAAFPSYNAQDIVDDPHMQSRGAIVDLSSWEGESRKVVGVPWRFSRTPGALDTWTPKLGQHNEYVFGELLGLNRTEIDALVEQEVIY